MGGNRRVNAFQGSSTVPATSVSATRFSDSASNKYLLNGCSTADTKSGSELPRAGGYEACNILSKMEHGLGHS